MEIKQTHEWDNMKKYRVKGVNLDITRSSYDLIPSPIAKIEEQLNGRKNQVGKFRTDNSEMLNAQAIEELKFVLKLLKGETDGN